MNDIGVGRIAKGVELVREGLAKFLVFVGGSRDEGELVASLAKAHGLDNSRVYIDLSSKHTVDNAYYAKRILENLKARRIALVTSKFHMERALAIFEWVLGDGFSIEPVPVHDNPGEDVVRREEYLRKFVPVMRELFAKGDAEGVRKAADILRVLLYSQGDSSEVR